MAEELAKIHAIPPARVPFLEEARLERMIDELDEVGEPHPAIELGLWWLRENRPPAREPVVVHGDYRIGNLVVARTGSAASSTGSSRISTIPCATSRSRSCARGGSACRRSGSAASAPVEPYLERYNELTGFDVQPFELDYWELAGNVGWAIGCLTQMQRHLTGQDRSVELATLGRLGAEVEYEIVNLLERLAA